jgi:phosphoglycolate phosphatase
MDKIIFDLDGTLLNSKRRLYLLFTNLISESNLSFDEYWGFKSLGISNKELIELKINNGKKLSYTSFNKDWMRLIESPEYLEYDQPFEGSNEVLERLKLKGLEMILCTARQNVKGVEEQLLKFKWSKYFEKVYVTEQKTTKVSLLNREKDLKKAFFVGDTSQDIQLAKKYAGYSIAVSSGFRSREYLNRFTPDYIIKDISRLIKLLEDEFRL